ncbi:hypothetical protein FRC02_006026 [Tulasnella sp. 418]|nr:hypothetical protein FRC02_006026 [Tulasnella sp. 418]
MDSNSDTEPSNDDTRVISRKRKRDEASGAPTDSQQPEESEVLSHARRRKLKKKSLKEEQAPNLKDEPHSSLNESNDEKPFPKRQNSVWVGNLSFQTTPDQLRDFFKEVGVVTRINMPSGKMKGRNRGFAYVDFETSEAQRMAITYSESNLLGRRLLIKDGGDFEGRPTVTNSTSGNPLQDQDAQPKGLSKWAQKILKDQANPAGPVLFMGNLGFETTVDSIRKMIDTHQRSRPDNDPKANSEAEVKGHKTDSDTTSGLRKVRMGTFEDSGNCKGWAFLDFASPQHATAALLNSRNHHLDGRKLVLQYATPDAVRRGGYRTKEAAKPQEDSVSKPLDRLRKSNGQLQGSDGASISGDIEDQKSPRKRVKREDAAANEHRKRGPTGGRVKQASHSRPKPGAALASAQREKMSIVASQGKKIVF